MNILLSIIGEVRSSIAKSPRVWAIGATVVCVLTIVSTAAAFVYHAGERHVVAQNQRAVAIASTALASTNAAIAAAKLQADTLHRSRVAADSAAGRATAHRDTVAAKHAAARARIVIASDSTVRVDSGPPVVVPRPLVVEVRSSDSLAAAYLADMQAKARDNQLLAAEGEARLHVGLLEQIRGDTLANIVAHTQPVDICGGGCRAVKTTAKVVALGAAGVLAYKGVKLLVRHWFPHS
jgi:hypothetical protein